MYFRWVRSEFWGENGMGEGEKMRMRMRMKVGVETRSMLEKI